MNMTHTDEIVQYIRRKMSADECHIPFPEHWSLQMLSDSNSVASRLLTAQKRCGECGDLNIYTYTRQRLFSVSVDGSARDKTFRHAMSAPLPADAAIPPVLPLEMQWSTPAMLLDNDQHLLLLYLPGVFTPEYMVCGASHSQPDMAIDILFSCGCLAQSMSTRREQIIHPRVQHSTHSFTTLRTFLESWGLSHRSSTLHKRSAGVHCGTALLQITYPRQFQYHSMLYPSATISSIHTRSGTLQLAHLMPGYLSKHNHPIGLSTVI